MFTVSLKRLMRTSTSFFCCVYMVVFFCPLKKMVEPDALFNIASVEHLQIRPDSARQEPSNTVSVNSMPVDPKLTIPVRESTSYPKPTVGSLVDVFPKPKLNSVRHVNLPSWPNDDPQQTHTQLKKNLSIRWWPLIEHLALGAGTEAGISAIAGGPRKYPAGISATAVVAGFKEGADAIAGRDTKKEAIFHALSILAGAGIVAAFWH